MFVASNEHLAGALQHNAGGIYIYLFGDGDGAKDTTMRQMTSARRSLVLGRSWRNRAHLCARRTLPRAAHGTRQSTIREPFIFSAWHTAVV